MIFNIICLQDGNPDSLLESSLRYIASNLDTVTYVDPFTGESTLELLDGIVLPAEICENLLRVYQQRNRVTDKFLKIFRDKTKTRLKNVRLHYCNVGDEGLKILLEHKLEELELSHCEGLTSKSLELINEHGDSLTSLYIGVKTLIFVEEEFPRGSPLFSTPKLRRLTLRRQSAALLPFLMLHTYEHLEHLNLSECIAATSLSCLTDLKRLHSLVLYNVHCIPSSIDIICGLNSLRHLDISQCIEKFGRYLNPNDVLAKLVRSLPDLVSLDISGTNLAGSGVAAHVLGSAGIPCDIPGLCSRVNNPLMFLGLYGTQHGACSRRDIPATVITGDKDQHQILLAAIAYMDRPELLTKVLNELYHLFRSDNGEAVTRIDLALTVVLEAMNQHIYEKNIQVSASATLFYIVKIKDHRSAVITKLKKRIITALLNAMEEHVEYEIMMRNGCLTLCQFKIPSDVVFEYKRIVVILLHGVDEHQDSFVQRVAIYLLNSLACQVDGGQKQFLGDKGVISRMLNLIKNRLNRQQCDDVLEVAWSAMWNVTDETPVNCRRFLDAKGMHYFVECLKCFPDKEELLRNMMGLLGNVAEVASLRPRLMCEKFLSVFYDLLNSCSDGIEVSYNAAGVLAHMSSGGEAKWTVANPSRADVLARLSCAIERWDLQTERNINYRSFEPILGLITVYHTPQCQHWAVWALANLTTVYPDKYCTLVKIEGGTALLQTLIADPRPYERIKELAAIVINNCHRQNILQIIEGEKTNPNGGQSPQSET